MIQILGSLKKINSVIDFIKNEPYIRCSLNEQPFETTIQSSDQFPDLIIPSKTVLNSWTKISGKQQLLMTDRFCTVHRLFIRLYRMPGAVGQG